MKRKYERSYRPEWEQDPLLSSWLSRAKDKQNVAFCKACNCKLITRLSCINEHGSSPTHKKNIIGYSGQSSVQQFSKIAPLEEVNLNKTKIRNKFLNPHVSLFTTKEGIKENGDCVSFKPTKNMIKKMSLKSMYTENDENLGANVGDVD